MITFSFFIILSFIKFTLPLFIDMQIDSKHEFVNKGQW